MSQGAKIGCQTATKSKKLVPTGPASAMVKPYLAKLTGTKMLCFALLVNYSANTGGVMSSLRSVIGSFVWSFCE